MNLLSFDYAEHHLVLSIDTELGLESFSVDETVYSTKPLSLTSIHEFSHPVLGSLHFECSVDIAQAKIAYLLGREGEVVTQGLLEAPEDALVALHNAGVIPPETPVPARKERSGMVLLGIGLKLFKTIKVVKVALMAATVAVYSVMFTFEFALALVAVLVFHEYGHLRAMKKFGIPTKGMYLIPFVGGLAIGDKPRTQWEDLYISMMGPVFGLLMTAVFYVIYLITGSHFCGLVTSTSALINIFNLIPVYPLDGGRIIKALVFSRRNYFTFILLLVISALCLVLSWKMGLAFLSFFIVLGVVDLIASWSIPLAQDMTPLKTYGIWFSLIWYLGVILAFIALILLIADANVPGSEIALKILRDDLPAASSPPSP